MSEQRLKPGQTLSPSGRIVTGKTPSTGKTGNAHMIYPLSDGRKTLTWSASWSAAAWRWVPSAAW